MILDKYEVGFNNLIKLILTNYHYYCFSNKVIGSIFIV